MKPKGFCAWMLVGLIPAALGCGNGQAGSPGQTGGAASGGVSASGGRTGSGGAAGSGGGTAGASAGGSGGSTPTSGQGGTTGTGGTINSSGGQGSGGSAGGSATGGKATGGSAGSAGAWTGGVSGTGGVATGGRSSGGATGNGGAATGGSTSGTGGRATGGSATGGSATGGSATGGATGNGGVTGGASGGATGGAPGTGGSTGTSAYRPCPTDGTPCKIMPFGDSITDGYNQNTPGGYRVELFRLIHSAGKNITFVGSGWNGPDTVDGAAFPHNHEGHSGWTIAPAGGRSGISTLVADVMPKYTPHIVLLMIGTNDCIDNYQLSTASTRLKDLIDSIYAKLPNVLIIVAQPIPSRGDGTKGDDTALSDRIKAFNATIPAVVKAQADAGKHILLVDMFTPFNPTKTSLLEDQWHPNLAGYVLIGAQWYSVLKSVL